MSLSAVSYTSMRNLLPLLLALLALPGTAEEKLAGGPYVVNAGPRSATVMWLMQDGHAAIGLDDSKLDQTAPLLRSQKITFTGLQPGKTYYYNVNGSESGQGSFQTAPLAPAPATATTAAIPAAPFQFVVFGDTRTRHD